MRTKTLGDVGANPYISSLSRTNENLYELMGREGSIRYRQMSRGDDQIGMILRVHKNPIRSCSWGIPLQDDATPAEKRCIDLLNKWTFSDNKISFQTFLGQCLSFMEYGYSAFELVWSTYQFENNKYFVPFLEQRLQTSIEEIMPKEKIVRQVTIEKGLLEIPFENMIFFILNQQGDDMRGESLLRNAYRGWKRKQSYESWIDIGAQRDISGVPTMEIPKSTRIDSPDYIAAELLLKNIAGGGENAYMITQEGWKVNIMASQFKPEQHQKIIEGINSGMALSVLAQFVMLGQNGNSGAFALSRDQSDFFLDGLQYVINIIESNYHRYVIRPFVKTNFGDTVDSSRVNLKGYNLNKKAGQELSNVLTALKGAGFITATVDDEIQLRKSLEMQPLSEDEVERRKEARNVPHESLINPEPLKKDDIQQDDDPQEEPKNNKIKLSEPKIKLRSEIIGRNNKEMLDFMKANLLLIKDKMMADIDTTLNRGVTEIQGLKNIEVSYAKYQKALERKLAGIAYDAWMRAKKDAKGKSIKFSEDKDPREIPNKSLQQFVLNQASSITEQQVATMKARAILTASNGPLKGYSINQTISNVSGIIDEYIDSNGVQVAGSLIVVGTDNFGASQFYQDIKDQLWGYRFVAVDDENTSDICSWYNGKTFSVDSPELADGTPPLHPNCRSYMEPIYKSEEKPEIEDSIAPESIRKQKSIY